MNQSILSAAALLAASLAIVVGFHAPAHAAASANDVQEGEQTYADNCATCHGEQLNNTSNGVTFDLRKLKPNEHARFVNSVLNGKNQMPPWRGVLDDEQINDIWDYIRASVDK